MKRSSSSQIFYSAFAGSLVADALSMPVHWYYDRTALDRDYGKITGYLKPRNPHSDSILWRSAYTPPNERGDILREQANYWGQRGIHYHQFLEAGQNTLNFQLARELFRWLVARGGYDAKAWLEHYIQCMLTPGWHRDTYVEEYHRAFFTNYGKGSPPERCGIPDVHIGGLAQVPALCAALAVCGVKEERAIIEAVATHVSLTHRHDRVLDAAKSLARLLIKISEGANLEDAMGSVCQGWISRSIFKKLKDRPDREVVGKVYSPACYIDDAFPASLYLVWRHQHDFSAAVCANAMVGGDNCHRGTVVGALLGAVHGVGDDWLQGLNPALPDCGSIMGTDK